MFWLNREEHSWPSANEMINSGIFVKLLSPSTAIEYGIVCLVYSNKKMLRIFIFTSRMNYYRLKILEILGQKAQSGVRSRYLHDLRAMTKSKPTRNLI